MFEFITDIDFQILDWVHENLTCPFLDFLMPIITLFGEYGLFFIVVALVMLIFKRTRKTGLMVGVSLLIGLLICNIVLKPTVARIRPYDLRPIDFELLIKKATDFSFPSGHTIAAIEAATVLMIRDKRFGIPALVLGVLISFSRIYLYIHYPSDVFTSMILGALIGIISVVLVNAIWKKVENSRAEKKSVKKN